MWVPELEIKPSPVFVALLVGLHGCVLWALWHLPGIFWLLLPLLLVSCLLCVAKHGLLLLKRSVLRVRLGEDGWYLGYRNQLEDGPLTLTARSHLGYGFIRLSLKGTRMRHVLITPAMVGQDHFRKLQVFLRWAADKQAAPAQPASR